MSERREISHDTHIERDEDGAFCLRDVRGEWFWLTQAAGEHLWEAAAPHREDGEGDAARMMVKNAIGFTRSEAWGQISDKARVVVLLDALRALDAQPPASDTERQCCKDDCIPGPFHDPDCPKFQDPTQPPEPSDTEGADTLTAGSDNRDVAQVDCSDTENDTEGSADYWKGETLRYAQNVTHWQNKCASIAAEARQPLVDAAEDALTVTASCAHERWYQRLWEVVRGEPWTGGPASEDSPIGLTQAEFDQCIADAAAEARRGVVEMIQKHFYEIADMQPDERPRVLHVLNALMHDISALAASPEEARDG